MKKFIKDMFMGSDNRYSSSKVWFHIVNLIVTIIYLKIGLAVALSIPLTSFNVATMGELAIFTLIYMGLVAGNKLATSFFGMRYGTTSSSNTNNTEISKE